MTTASFPPGSTRIPRRALHYILHFLAGRIAAGGYLPGRNPLATEENILKNQPTSTLSGEGLCLLKTQFAKKPKNPV